ncbi:hypothetical protein NUW58_g2137 [Xylaria curta]|uniref:Uncharacterized protein n=1 Tax=Xylaria curta TaxID=42375 RepID=A0ACC1PH22_9PEZI|nr:hypothetical protein NUW58_g2137 [Xylaria curta]
MSTSPVNSVIKELPGDEPLDVVFNNLYGLRTIELNRPAKLNSLNASMIRKIVPRLVEWEQSDLANVIVMKGAGDRAFCAGGDVAALAKQNMEGPDGQKASVDYFALEYKLNHYIATYNKPYIAFMDGITMGGGVGLSIHAPFRIATERTVFAMPETTIGFFPDVGASFFLPRMNGAIGTYLALTSDKLTGANVFYSGVATHYLHSTSLPNLESRLAELRFKDYDSMEKRLSIIEMTIEEYATGLPPKEPILFGGELRRAIDRCFSRDTVADVITALKDEQGPTKAWAEKTLDTLHQRSPTAVHVALKQMRVGRGWSIAETFQREHQIAAKFMPHPDFTEGVSARLLSKGRLPKWQPASLEDVNPKDKIEAPFFRVGEDLPRLELLTTRNFEEYPYQSLGVPTEHDVEEIVREGTKTPQEVLAHFVTKKNGRQGISTIVEEILNRKTTIDVLLRFSDFIKAAKCLLRSLASFGSIKAMAHNNGSWERVSPAGEERGPQVRPMGLKVHYTFDQANQERCLARWPQVLHIQTIPVDGQTIGVIDLSLCLQAVSHCSPELAGDEEKDYAVYAFDYSEPDTPLVGQGLLSRGLSQGTEPREPKLITGRVTQNLLAIFGNGIKETLEVKLKLTAISRAPRSDPMSRPQSAVTHPPNLAPSSSALSESGEWGSFVQSHPGLALMLEMMRLTIIRPYNPHPVADPAQLIPNSRERNTPSFRQTPPLAPARQSPTVEEAATSQPIAKVAKPQTQSRPNSRASSRPPTGRPRGRPRKRPLASEGNTSGYEDGTDGDDAPSRAKKRATITKAERSNTATFGSAPESLRVAASTAGSIRNFRPVAPAGDVSTRSHLQEEGPRAPTPVPEPRFQGHTQSRVMTQSSLRQQSMTSQSVESLPNPSYPELNLPMSQDARSPMDSVAPSPFSDEPSPADISSSPPVPRSAMFSMRSSPAPSSPILPPMRAPVEQPDSGFMSGGLEDNRIEQDSINKSAAVHNAPAPTITKPKPRRSRAKKQEPKPQQTLLIHNETPGPPELLPQTSIYNPPRPQGSRKKSAAGTPVAADSPITNPTTAVVPEAIEVMGARITEEHSIQETEQVQSVMPPQTDFDALEAVLNEYPDDQRFLETLDIDINSFSPADDPAQAHDTPYPSTLHEGKMEPPAVPTPISEPSVEPELPTVPASDPVLPQASQVMPMSGGPHPQTDAVDGMDSRMNKNYVKRQAIKQKLEEAVALGEMPSFCSNCGALQTPTWRKIWKQERRGVPAYHEYSEKPGHVTAINVLERDDTNNPTLYEVIKKSLGPMDDKTKWTETILCNPCGIWFSKWKAHRPPEKWEKDEQRLTQTRKKRAAGGGTSRSRKSRAKSDGQMNLTSEAYPPTDPVGPSDALQSPKESSAMVLNADQAENVSEHGSGRNRKRITSEPKDQGSTHSRASRASGTAMSPIDLDEELGATRRLLFPSPRKDGEQKILGEVAVNIVQTCPKMMADGEMTVKKNLFPRSQTPEPPNNDFVDLFGPTPRPTTPPPKGPSIGPPPGPPEKHLDQHSSPSSMRRRSPRHLLPSEAMGDGGLGTPLTHSISQMFSDTDHLVMPSPSRGFELDFSSLPHIDNIDQQSGLPHFDFATLLATDSLMPSSPPALRSGDALGFGGSLEFEIDVHNLQFHGSPRRKGVKRPTNNGEYAP